MQSLRNVLSGCQKQHFNKDFNFILLLIKHLVLFIIKISHYSKYICIFHSHTFVSILSYHGIHLSSFDAVISYIHSFTWETF